LFKNRFEVHLINMLLLRVYWLIHSFIRVIKWIDVLLFAPGVLRRVFLLGGSWI
jgi:hypothetical protein